MTKSFCTQNTDRECREEDCCLGEICQKCKSRGEDRRTLWMACFYDMKELGIPFEKETVIEGGVHDGHPNAKHSFFTLRVCKECRSDWMSAIQKWWMTPIHISASPGTGIFIREFGKTTEISEEQWKERYPNIEPVRFKDEPGE